MGEKVHIKVGTRELTVTNLDKVLYPATGTTKGQLIKYYERIAPYMLPHLKDRPLTLVRAPNGVDSEYFFEKHAPSHRPDWIRTGGPQNNCVADSTASLVWFANLAAVELHMLQATIKKPDRPLGIIFDLDPGPPSDLAHACSVALRLREMLQNLNLESVAKTSGGKGLHMYVPLHTPCTEDQTKSFAKAVGGLLAKYHPGEVLTDMPKAKRTGKIFIDWSQNDDAKTTIAPYSTRLAQQPMVSTPVTWEEVEAVVRTEDASNLAFDIDTILERVDQIGDVYAPALSLKQKLPDLAQAK